jgi:hypothetical protein
MSRKMVVSMKMPMTIAAVYMVVPAGYILARLEPCAPHASRQMMEGLPREPNHAIKCGEADHGQIVQPAS